MEREALRLALYALKEIARDATTHWVDEWCGELANKTLIAINALAQPAQEPKSVTYKEVADTMNALRKGNFSQQAAAKEVGKLKLYTAPPQRTWVDLTDEDIHNTVGYNETREMYQFALALIAKLKDKNT